MSTERVQAIHERRRAEIVASVPAGYRPWLHMVLPSALGLAAMVGALSQLRAVRAIELLAIPITLLVGFAFEWRVHKEVLHSRQPGLSVLYERHELAHHVIYTDRDLAMRSPRELFLILMPPYAVVIVFFLNSLFGFAVAAAVGWNAALLMLTTSMVFFLSYEWLHLSYHQPPESWIGQRRVIRVLRELHRRHHDPSLMKRWNFNVTVPVFDFVHRTLWSPERFEARAAARRKREGRDERRTAAGHQATSL